MWAASSRSRNAGRVISPDRVSRPPSPSDEVGIKVEHPPTPLAPPRGMPSCISPGFTVITSPAPASTARCRSGAMRAEAEHADAELIVRVPGEVTVRGEGDRLDPADSGSMQLCPVHITYRGHSCPRSVRLTQRRRRSMMAECDGS